MTDNTWQDLISKIEDKVGIIRSKNHKESLPDKLDLEKEVSQYWFNSNGQSFRIERVVSPRVIDQKTIYNKSGHSKVKVNNIYSDNEISSKVSLYRYIGNSDEVESVDLEVLIELLR